MIMLPIETPHLGLILRQNQMYPSQRKNTIPKIIKAYNNDGQSERNVDYKSR